MVQGQKKKTLVSQRNNGNVLALVMVPDFLKL